MGKTGLKKGEKIEIYWRDSTSLHGWHNEDYIDKNAFCSPCKSIGYFYKKTKNGFILSRTVETDSKERLETEIIPEKVKRLR